MKRPFLGLTLTCALTTMTPNLSDMGFFYEKNPISVISSEVSQSSKVEDWGINRLIKEGLIEEIKSRIEQGFNINSIDEFGWTPLMYACLWEKTEIVQLLIENGSNVMAQSRHGVSPLIIAVHCENVPLIKILLDYGAPVLPTGFLK